MEHKTLKATATVEHEHFTLKALVTTTDQGSFEAVISTQSVDRERDVVSADGMVKALRKWPRPIPLAWEHSTKPEDIFGTIDPKSVKNVNGEVVASGQVDLESERGHSAWRAFKARSLGFSFAYLILADTKRADGGRDITELDVFEITACRAPMNNDTRVLSTKAAPADMADRMRALADELAADNPDQADRIRAMADQIAAMKAADADLRRRGDELALELVSDRVPLGEPATKAAPEDDATRKELEAMGKRLEAAEQALEEVRIKAERTAKEPQARAVDPLRKRGEELALEVASDGMSLRRPPTKRVDPPPELVPVRELKRRSRDLMDLLLSDIPEQQT